MSDSSLTTTKLLPIHPGEVLEHGFLKPLEISQIQLATAIGVDTTRIHSIVLGTRSISAETALLLSRFFGNTAKFWMGLQAQYDLERAEDELAERLVAIVPWSSWSEACPDR